MAEMKLPGPVPPDPPGGPVGASLSAPSSPLSAASAPASTGESIFVPPPDGGGATEGGGPGSGGGVPLPGKAGTSAAMAAAYAAAAASSTGGGGSGGGGGGGGGVAGSERYNWMPSLTRSQPSRECIRRVRTDIRSIMRDPVPGLFVCPDEDLVTVIHALVTGPFDTPYEGGFYYFVLHCPDDYPHRPPRVRLMTTGGGTVRFNPNLYANGKVCLSILGTWSGPSWSPVHSISSVLLSIQSLMNEKPYTNEPGYEAAANPQDVRDYNDCIVHENLRVAVCSMVDDSSLWKSMPPCFQVLTRELFPAFMTRYEEVCKLNMHRDGERLPDPFDQNKGKFRYASIARSIERIAAKLGVEAAATPEDEEAFSPVERQSTGRQTPQQSVDAAVDRGSGGSGGGGGGGGGGLRGGFQHGFAGDVSSSSAAARGEESTSAATLSNEPTEGGGGGGGGSTRSASR